MLKHIRASVRTSRVRNDKSALDYLMNYMRQVSRKGSIPTLVISEQNTTGASDVPEDDGTSMWEALTNAEGVDVKANVNSGGSHGIGKNAPYTISVPRTILYSTKFRHGGMQKGQEPIHRKVHPGFSRRERSPLQSRGLFGVR